MDHKPVPWSKRHEAVRDHLQAKQWFKNQSLDHTALRNKAPIFPPNGQTGEFTIEELQQALAKAKRNKAPTQNSCYWNIIMRFGVRGQSRQAGRRPLWYPYIKLRE